MSDPIQTICSLTGCSEKEANEAFDICEDVIEAVDLLLARPKTTPIPKRIREITPQEEFMAPIRKMMKQFDERMSTSLNRHGYEGSVEKLDHHEEKAPQSNCGQECQLPSQQLTVQKQETVCPSPSECSSGLQLNVHTSPYSGQECSQLIHLQEMESLEMGGQITVVVPSYEQSLSLPIEVDFEDQLRNRLQENFQNYPEVLSQDSQQH
jgi:hypothetical protein